MKQRCVRLLGLLLVLALLGAGCGRTTEPTKENSIRVEDKPQIIIGFVGPLSGPNEPQGVAAFTAFQLAFEQWQENKNLPYQLTTLEMDDEADAETAIAQCEELVTFPELVATAGFWTSGSAAAGIPIFQKESVPLVIWGANGDGLLSHKTYPLVTRVCPSYGQEASALAEGVFGKLGYHQVFVVAEDNEDARGLANSFRLAAKDWPVKVVDTGHWPGNPKNAGDLLAAIQKSGTELVYFAGSAHNAGLCRKAMSDAGLTEVTLCGISNLTGQGFLTAAGKSAEGSLSLQAGVDLQLSQAGQDFLAAYDAQKCKFPVTEGTVYAYDAAQTIIAALETIEGVPTKEAMRQAIAAVRVEGLTGRFAFDEQGQATARHGMLLEMKQNTWQEK